MKDILEECIKSTTNEEFVELRWQKKESRSFYAEKDRVENSSVKKRSGVGVRVLVNGTWGFAFTSTPEKESILSAIQNARKSAIASADFRKDKIHSLAKGKLAKGSFPGKGVLDLQNKSIEEKIQLVYELQNPKNYGNSKIQSVGVGYSEIFEEKAIVTNDGVSVDFSLVRPEFRVSATANKDSEIQIGSESVGVTGGWDCLFRDRSPESFLEDAKKTAVDLLDSTFPEGGVATVILSPSIVGLLVHEAIGHTVEADFVLSGSVAKDKINQKVASDLVNLSDSGSSEYYEGAGGTLPVDDEGVFTEKTQIIENGILKSYLHNRETAAKFGVEPTGSARAWEFSDLPLIRMRNTYLHPGESSFEEMISNTKEGYYLEGAKNGQADSTGEFMFAVQKAYKIENGKLTKLLKGITVSGLAFDVLNQVDMVSKEFKWDLGSGYCGKGQPAKVDAGGPYVRTKALLGGV
jgi:TldD protein